MTYNSTDWEIVKAFYERGLSLAAIIARPEVKVTSRSQVSRKAAEEGWERASEKQQLINLEVQTKQSVADVFNQKMTLNATELIIHNTLVDERAKHIEFFSQAAILNVRQAMSYSCEDQQDYRARAETISKGRETVLGKTGPDIAVQINNTVTLEELLADL
jgi:hypothetical protein